MTSMTRVRLCAAVAAACLVALAGCDGTPAPSPSPTATVNPTPPETSLERQQREDFEAAEKSYRTFMAEANRLAVGGGANNATPTMKQYATGSFLDYYVNLLRGIKTRQEHNTTGVEIGFVHQGQYTPYQLTLEVCEDGSKNRVLDRNGKQISSGQVGLRSVYMRKSDGRWKAWNGDEHGSAASCQA